jgi:hypothetical protein
VLASQPPESRPSRASTARCERRRRRPQPPGSGVCATSRGRGGVASTCDCLCASEASERAQDATGPSPILRQTTASGYLALSASVLMAFVSRSYGVRYLCRAKTRMVDTFDTMALLNTANQGSSCYDIGTKNAVCWYATPSHAREEVLCYASICRETRHW